LRTAQKNAILKKYHKTTEKTTGYEYNII